MGTTVRTRVSFSLLLGTALVLSACAHQAPPPVRTASIAPKPALPKPIDRSIGKATMLADGTIVMEMKTTTDMGGGPMIQRIKPADTQYAMVVKRLGGLKPGQTKPFETYPLQ
jgi:hypothetical protein